MGAGAPEFTYVQYVSLGTEMCTHQHTTLSRRSPLPLTLLCQRCHRGVVSLKEKINMAHITCV